MLSLNIEDKHRVVLWPTFSVQRKQDESKEMYSITKLKHNTAIHGFNAIIAGLISGLYKIDEKDQLLQGINNLRSQDRLLMEQQNIEQNNFANKQALKDKFNNIFQEPVCKLVEKNNYVEICEIIKEKSGKDAMPILTNIVLMVNNSH